MENESLKSLVENLKAQKIEAIKFLVENKSVEQYFVDFKRAQSQDYSGKKGLENADRNNLAKAISGFGNSEGGIIIWGIDTSKEEGDFADSLNPIVSPENFSSLINQSISRLTIPQHPTVECFVIKEDDKKGFVVTVIPKFEGLPIQTIVGEKFYMRVGESFVNIPYAILSGMFGKKPHPDVIQIFTLEKGIKKDANGFITFTFGTFLVNRGKGIARDIFLNCSIFGLNAPSTVTVQPTDSNFTAYNVFSSEVNLISKDGFKLGPKQKIQPLIFKVSLKPPFNNEAKFHFTVGAEGQVPYEVDIRHQAEDLRDMYDKLDDKNYKDFGDRFLKVPDDKELS